MSAPAGGGSIVCCYAISNFPSTRFYASLVPPVDCRREIEALSQPMSSKSLPSTIFLAAFALVLTSATDSSGQSGSRYSDLRKVPGGGPGGYASQELANIRRTAVGTGYTGSQLNSQTLNRSRARVPFTGVSSVDRTSGRRPAASFSSRGNTGPASKPFSNVSRRPTVSPYLNLFNESFDEGGTDLNYQTLVRPQLQQRQINDQLQQQTQALNRRLQEIAAQPSYNQQGSTRQAPTGHSTFFQVYSHFYPSAGPQRRR